MLSRLADAVQQIQRAVVGQLGDGMILEAPKPTSGSRRPSRMPRDNH